MKWTQFYFKIKKKKSIQNKFGNKNKILDEKEIIQ